MILTADDLGLTPEWDDAIRDAWRAKTITAVSFVTNGPTYDGAVNWLRDQPELDTGVHLNVLSGRPLSPRSEVRSLVGDDGEFRPGWAGFVARFFAGIVRRAEVAIEWDRQVRRACDDGLRPCHLNSHYHLHLLPGLFDIAEDIAERYGIGCIRVAGGTPRAIGIRDRVTVGLAFRAVALWAVSHFLPRDRRGVIRVPFVGSDIFGSSIGEWSQTIVRLRAGVTEIVCHPGQFPGETAALRSSDLRARVQECAVLTRFREIGSRCRMNGLSS